MTKREFRSVISRILLRLLVDVPTVVVTCYVFSFFEKCVVHKLNYEPHIRNNEKFLSSPSRITIAAGILFPSVFP